MLAAPAAISVSCWHAIASATSWASDYSADAVEVARKRGIEAHVIDLDHEPLDASGFDVVVFADVLEHLRDHGSVLQSARGAGRAIVSLPNIGNWTARPLIVAGRFPLEGYGLFDRTHLRFFTRESAKELLTANGWTLTGRNVVPGPLPFRGPRPRRVAPRARGGQAQARAVRLAVRQRGAARLSRIRTTVFPALPDERAAALRSPLR